MNPNQLQSLEDEQSGEEEIGQDIDWDAIYGGEDVDMADYDPSPELKKDYRSIFGDVLKQGTKEVIIGAGGAYGDLQELFGVGNEEASTEKNKRDFATLDKLDSGQSPSFAEIDALSDDGDILNLSKFPTSGDLRNVNDQLGGPGEPETGAGKYAARTGRLVGSGLPFGQVNPLPGIVGGTAGQAVEDLGGGPLAQAAAEIAGMILTPTKGLSGLDAATKTEVRKKIADLRQLGYTDEQITLAINAANKGGKAGKIASKSNKTEDAFENFATKSDEIVNDILAAEIPGIEHGTEYVHKLASDAYGQVADKAKNIKIPDSTKFINTATDVVQELIKSLGSKAKDNPFLVELKDAVVASTKNPSAESYIAFYQKLNRMGNWTSRSQKDRILGKVKDSIKDTFRAQGKAGQKLADDFERVNKGVQKAYQAEEAHNLLQKVTTQGGIDYKKMSKLFDKADNVEVLENAIGPRQTDNLRKIANTGKEIKDFDKAWKKTNTFRLGSGADTARAAVGSYFLYQGDWEGLAYVAASKGGTMAAKKLAEKSLTDPKFQNLMIRGLHAIKSESPRTLLSVNNEMKKYLEEQGIDIDLD